MTVRILTDSSAENNNIYQTSLTKFIDDAENQPFTAHEMCHDSKFEINRSGDTLRNSDSNSQSNAKSNLLNGGWAEKESAD